MQTPAHSSAARLGSFCRQRDARKFDFYLLERCLFLLNSKILMRSDRHRYFAPNLYFLSYSDNDGVATFWFDFDGGDAAASESYSPI